MKFASSIPYQDATLVSFTVTQLRETETERVFLLHCAMSYKYHVPTRIIFILGVIIGRLRGWLESLIVIVF